MSFSKELLFARINSDFCFNRFGFNINSFEMPFFTFFLLSFSIANMRTLSFIYIYVGVYYIQFTFELPVFIKISVMVQNAIHKIS